jgi:hypothetical protein
MERAEKANRSEGEFDREAEKEFRKGVRKGLTKSMSEALKDSGFRKTRNAVWSREREGRWNVVYLQRSQFAHEYFVEAGVCDKEDVPDGEKPDIVHCDTRDRERIEQIVKRAEKERAGEGVDEDAQKKFEAVRAALRFEAPGSRGEHRDDYFVPSVSQEEADAKIATIKDAVEEYVPLWFDKESSSFKE